MDDWTTLPLERSGRRPLYQQIKEAVAAAIEAGSLPPLTRLPPTRALAHQLGVDRVTVVTAYNELAAEGYISAHVGRGSFVLDRATAGREGLASPPPSLRAPADWTAHNLNREMMRLARRPDIISFAPGMPATDLLPVDAYRLALNTVLRRDGPEVLQYGLIEGYPPLLAAIATELAGMGMRVEPDQLLITSGTEQALALVLRTLLHPGDTVLIEQPTYALVLDVLAGTGVVIQPVPCDENGVIPEALPDLIARCRPRLLYLTPTFQNPTGACMPLARRHHLLALAAEHDLFLLEDDVYAHLWLDAPPPPSLRALDPSDHVIYTNGYSKCLLPGARIGYLLAPARLHGLLAAAHQTLDISASELHQRALETYLGEGRFASHLTRLRGAYRQRRQAMLEALAEEMPAGATWTRPGGGLYCWLQLPVDGPSATTVYVHALDTGVAFAPGHLSFPVAAMGMGGSHHARLNFTLHPPTVTAAGIHRLARAWRQAAGET